MIPVYPLSVAFTLASGIPSILVILLLNLSVWRGVAVTNELRCQPFLFLVDGIITTPQQCALLITWSTWLSLNRSRFAAWAIPSFLPYFSVSISKFYVYIVLIVMIIMTHSYTALVVKETYRDSSVLLSHDQQSLSTLRWESVVDNSRS